MCDPVTTALTVASMAMGSMQGKQQEKQAQAAAKQAEKNAAETQRQGQREQNRLNAKSPDTVAIQAENANAAKGGGSSTMLTGPSGIDPSLLALGKNTLLGRTA